MAKAKKAKTPEAIFAGKRLRSVREGLGVRREDLAKLLNVVVGTISNYENGIRELDIRTAQRCEKHLGVPAAYLMGLVDDDDMEFLRQPKEVKQGIFNTLASSTAVLPRLDLSEKPENQA